MRAGVLATLLTALPSALAWQITVYREYGCAENEGAFDYYTFEGQGTMDYCWGLKESSFPNGVVCNYFSERGTSGPHPCDGQIDIAKAFKVIRGKVMFWEKYDSHPAQRDDRRCSDRLLGFSDADKEDDGNIFHEEDYRCRDTYYGPGDWTGARFEKTIQGFRAWE